MIHLFSQLIHLNCLLLFFLHYTSSNTASCAGTNPCLTHCIHKKRKDTVHTISFLFESDCIIPYSFYTYKSSDKSYQNFNISDNTFCRFVRYKPILHPLWKKFWHTHRTADGPSCPQTAEGNSPFPPCGSGSLSCRTPDRFRHIW